ncbi:hypothetical protein D9613_012549 [Agrocybe pediades]|uniref:Uncharacterized protein n=1 Tax=Agrocybe pediades TaxID=84607 RepID=A0A8H4QQS4_9AGAR|nr:hypothetical protein D9613_012549 [Agrocybe pediades]
MLARPTSTPSGSEPTLICFDTQFDVKLQEQKSLGYPHYFVKGDAVVDRLLQIPRLQSTHLPREPRLIHLSTHPMQTAPKSSIGLVSLLRDAALIAFALFSSVL